MIKLTREEKEEIINYLDQFMDFSSYAIWGKDKTDISGIVDRDNLIETFNPNYVLVAFNQSGEVNEKYKNFHMTRNETRLMKTINRVTELNGAFITDLFAGNEVITKTGDELKKELKANKALKEKLIKDFLIRVKPFIKLGSKLIAIGETIVEPYLSEINEIINQSSAYHYSGSAGKTYDELEKSYREAL